MSKKESRVIISDSILFTASLLSLMALAFDFGFPDNFWSHLITDIVYLIYGGITFLYFVKSPLLIQKKEYAF